MFEVAYKNNYINILKVIVEKLDVMLILKNIFLEYKVVMSSAQTTNSTLSLIWRFSYSAVISMYALYILSRARIFPSPIPSVFCIAFCP